METLPFDERYIAGIRNRDPEIESHFVAYFKMPVWLKARRQLRSLDMAEDAAQETVLRVLRFFRSGKSLESPEKLPAFVHKTCHNVTLEMLRSKSHHPQPPETSIDPVDTRVSVELEIITEERKQMVREILSQLPEKDRELLRLAMLEEMDKDVLCKRYGVNQDYLRVLLHRARLRFRAALLKTTSKDLAKGRGVE